MQYNVEHPFICFYQYIFFCEEYVRIFAYFLN